MKKKRVTGGNFFALGLYAFLGLGMEVLIMMIEQGIYGRDLSELGPAQHVLHWVITCIVWGVFAIFLARWAKGRYRFDIGGQRQNIPVWGILLALLLTGVCVALNAWSWGGLKILGEFSRKGPLLFTFQYIYYIFETLLIFSVIAYGQKAGELWFERRKIPWGGLLAGLTWGLAHALTRGSIFTGLEALLAGILYGCIYLLVKKRALYALPLIFLAFAL